MTSLTRTVNNFLKRITVQTIRQTAAIALILALILPIAVPIPVFGTTFSSPRTESLGLVAETSLITKASDLISAMPLILASIAGKTRAARKDNSKSNNVTKIRSANVKAVITPIEERVEMKTGESRQLSAVPVDAKGKSINGVPLEWKSSNCDVVKIEDDRIIALKAGETKLTLTAGNFVKEHLLTVSGESIGQSNLPPPDDLEEEVYRSFFTPQENLGTPPGQVEAQSPAGSAAMRRSLERPGSSNFSFDIPVASLPGRGSDAGINITYNSRLWGLNVSSFSQFPSRYRYNQDNDWLAPGFKLTMGELRRLDYYNFFLTSPNGTKHQLHYVSGNPYARTYESADGTFVRLNVTSTDGTTLNNTAHVAYPDGSRVVYSMITGSSSFFYPTRITDSNGNITQIAYRDTTGRIWYIKDTLNRYITFHYDSANKLVAVTVPGFDDGDDRQTVRFYYDTINFDTTTQRFSGAITNHTVPAVRWF